ncbi:myelin and lymphocyte protein isoform X2 [Bos mutus]|uniref:myelin and lymphocyte protein isoform X2 n=1 Tax=Bos mutus TaxID=72004 RepID=UPI0038B61357
MATGTASGGRRLPRGSAVFTTFPDLLFIFEFVPVPLVQGWVLFVSVSCFIVTTLLLFLYIVGAHKNWNFWITLDTAYHCLAALFYFSASALETLVTIGLQDDIHKHYSENISAVVFSIIVTLLYMVHAVFSLIRCKVSYRNREHS